MNDNNRPDNKAFQDYYPDNLSHCYGCGRLNAEGLQIKTYWDGEETVTRYRPRPYHTAIPGFVYGGVLASLIDCHGTGTAAAAAYRAEGRAMNTEPAFRYVTASLAMFGLTKLDPKPKRVLFLHTGGLPGLLAEAHTMFATVAEACTHYPGGMPVALPCDASFSR